MSLGQRFERRLEGMVGNAFARVFKGQVEPVEIGSALQREATEKKAVMGSGQVLAPNRYRVTLGRSDFERLSPWETQLTRSLAELVQEHLDENGLQTIGDIEVYLALDEGLHTGVFGIASRMEPQAPPRRRPYDSMSMPVVPGKPDEYVQPYGAGPAPTYPPPLSRPDVAPPPVAAPTYGQPPYGQPAYGQPSYGQGHDPQGYGNPAYPAQGQQVFDQADSPPPYLEAPRRPAFSAQVMVDGTGETHRLSPGSNIIGRGHDCDLQLMDNGVSRRHVDIHVAEGRAVLYDLGSTNGTSVNGHTVQSQELAAGDVIRLGHSRLVYQQERS